MLQDNARGILLNTLRIGDDQMRAEWVAPASEEVWQAVLALARQHRVAPLLYWRLKMLRAAQVPSSVLHALRVEYLNAAHVNAQLFERLAHVLAALRIHNIPTIALKGAYLASSIYPTIAVRSMHDVDLLVHASDLARTDALLQTMDLVRQYALAEPIEELAHLSYCHSVHPLHLEVHWSIAPEARGLAIDVDGLWARARPAKLRDLSIACLSPEDQLLHLGIHAALHNLEFGLRPLVDMAWLINHHGAGLDWRAIAERARAWRATRCTFVTFSLARELAGAAVPDECLAALEPTHVDSDKRALAREHLLASVEMSDRAMPDSAGLIEIWAATTLGGKALRLLQSFFRPPQVMATWYPVSPNSPRMLLYYPVRWLYLLQRYWHQAWGILRGHRPTMARAQRQREVNALRDWLLSG